MLSFNKGLDSLINKIHNLQLKNHNNYELDRKNIEKPRQKQNSFIENGNRILSKADFPQNKNINHNPYIKKGKNFFQNQQFSGTDNFLSKKIDNNYFQNNIGKKIGEDLFNYNSNQNTLNYKYLDGKGKKKSNDSENNNSEEKLYSIISSKIGLKNLGDTCYMNVCLQNLIHSRCFIRKLLLKRSLINEQRTPITNEFLKLCEKMSIPGTSSIEPSDFRYIFCKKHKEFGKFAQFDTIEFCRYLLEDISSELNEIKERTPYRELSTFGKSKIQCFKEFTKLFRSKEDSIVIDCFYGSTINIFTCTCNYETYSFQKFLDLPLLLPGGTNRTSVDDLLSQYFKRESIDFNTKCEKCCRKEIHDKEIKLSFAPKILILSLQRMDERTNRKNNCEVKFEEKLLINDYIDDECQDGNKYVYRLYGVGCHSGNINYGHYYAYIKINDQDWYEFNDSKVNYIGGNIETTSKYVYVLFYKRRKIK
jgi:ubiquitin C-terminal hydrolase